MPSLSLFSANLAKFGDARPDADTPPVYILAGSRVDDDFLFLFDNLCHSTWLGSSVLDVFPSIVSPEHEPRGVRSLGVMTC